MSEDNYRMAYTMISVTIVPAASISTFLFQKVSINITVSITSLILPLCLSITFFKLHLLFKLIDWACKELCYGQHGNRIYHHSPDLHCICEPNKRNLCRLPLSTLLWISIHIH